MIIVVNGGSDNDNGSVTIGLEAWQWMIKESESCESDDGGDSVSMVSHNIPCALYK